MRGIVIAGAASGVGKTVVTLAAIHALVETGLTVQPAKAGPDFIDPSHHAAVAGRPSRTLDGWLEGQDGLLRNYHRGEGDICVIEGVMGLYDGDQSSTAAVAEALDLPVVLALDASAGMESVGATALGFEQYASRVNRDLDVVGIIANRAHGGRHANGIRRALPDGMSYFGRVPPLDGLEIPNRHLGLLMTDEAPIDADILAEAAAHIDADGLFDGARNPPKPIPDDPQEPTDCRIAVARDDAFRFVYPATLERLRERAELVSFAPVAGDDLPSCDGVYLPGGHPELYAAELSTSPALESLAEHAAAGLAVLGECGGLMVLAETLTDLEGHRHRMAGVLPAEISVHDRYQALDHVELAARQTTLTARAGRTLRGHEFHYSSADTGSDARFAFDVQRGAGIDGDHDGLTEYRTLGTYCHVHAESGAFDTFIDSV